jgi:hypothetical protein
MHDPSLRTLKWQMFALSFTALFLEMMVIRWVPSVVHLVAYYANLMLLSSFLGLGVGAMTSTRGWGLFRWFPVALGCEIAIFLFGRNITLMTTASELRFGGIGQGTVNTAVLVALFATNALLFVPLGERMGVLFGALPRLTAYAWDLGGSLCGTLAFGLFSLTFFSPVYGLAIVMLAYLALSPVRRWLLTVPVFAWILVVMYATGERAAVWSPYYYVTVTRLDGFGGLESVPPPDVRTMRNPPIYNVNVNQLGYHLDGTIDPARYAKGSDMALVAKRLLYQYTLPYALCQGRERVVVFGGGGGMDVQAALLSGVRHVDAVEIDPAIIRLSKKFSAGAPYSDPRVSVHIDDARSFEAKAAPGYDLAVFGYLDSQALFSSMNNVRLDGYVYTVESIRKAYSLLNDHGMMSLAFGFSRPWLAVKLYETVVAATGQIPAVYQESGQIVFCVARDRAAVFPAQKFQFTRMSLPDPVATDLPTDDWPFLYLQKKTVPTDYLWAIGSMLVLSLAAVAILRRSSFGRIDGHFLLLGMGFMLLETKSISDCTLYFGATWLVTTIVVAGVLLLVMAANLVASRMKAFSFRMYLPLFLVLAALLVVPRGQILALEFPYRLAWAMLAVPLPVFFAGIIFSTTFRDCLVPAAAFGANLIGAMIGGFCEYLTMAVGNHSLSILVIAAYLGSLGLVLSTRRAA